MRFACCTLTPAPSGVRLPKDIRDAYAGDVDGKRIEADVKALADEGAIYMLTLSDNKVRDPPSRSSVVSALHCSSAR